MFRSMRLPRRHAPNVFVFFMTLMMSVVLSGVMTALAGLDDFATRWLAAFVRSYAMVVPAVLIVAPLARRLTELVLEDPPRA